MVGGTGGRRNGGRWSEGCCRNIEEEGRRWSEGLEAEVMTREGGRCME